MKVILNELIRRKRKRVYEGGRWRSILCCGTAVCCTCTVSWSLVIWILIDCDDCNCNLSGDDDGHHRYINMPLNVVTVQSVFTFWRINWMLMS